MGIVIGNPDVIPQVAYDHIHVMNITIEQPIFTDDLKQPKYLVYILYKLYGVHEGTRYYEQGSTRRLRIDDFFQLAMEQAMQGNMVLVGAMQALEQAVSLILSNQTQFGNLEVS